MKADKRESNMASDWYVGNPTQSLGWHTDRVKKMTAVTHAHFYANQEHWAHLMCLNPNDETWR